MVLNKSRRVIMAIAVLTSLPSYGMKIRWFPQYACETLDHTMRNFFWLGGNDKAMHMVSWKKIS